MPDPYLLAEPQTGHPDAAVDQAVDPAVLLEILGQAPIVFHRIFVDITGSVTAALWLSYALYALEAHPAHHDGWFSKSQDEWQRDTGLTRREQETARKRLRVLDLLEERRAMNLPLAFRVNCLRLHALIDTHARRVHASMPIEERWRADEASGHR